MRRLRLPVVLFVALLMQRTVMSDLRVAAVQPDVLLLFAILAGVSAGSEAGAVLGFAAGIAADLFTHTPFGLSALAFALVGYAVGALQGSVIRAAWWITPLTAVVASAAGVVLYALMGAVIGQAHFVRPQLLGIAAVVAAVNGLLSLPSARAVAWAVGGRSGSGGYAR